MLEALDYIVVYTLIFGSFYLGLALGFTVITGVLRIFHLGYGALFLVAAYGTWLFCNDIGVELPGAIVLALILIAAFTFVLYRVVVVKFIEVEDYLLAGLFAIFVIIQEIVSYVYPETVGVYLPTTIISGSVPVGHASVPGQYIVVSTVSLVIMLVFLVFLLKTKAGLIIRAISQNTTAAKLCGVKFDRTYAVAMVIASIPAGIIMVTIAPIWPVNPFIGMELFSFAMLPAVLGGLGNLRGTLIASYIIGFIHAFCGFAINPRLMLLVSLVVVLVILAVRPRGIVEAETVW